MKAIEKKILVTGATGKVGRAFINAFLDGLLLTPFLVTQNKKEP